MEFEYEPAKSAANKDKHGIDFEDARTLWRDDDGITLEASFVAETPYLLVAVLDEKLWTAVHTIQNANIRIISVRRARQDETEAYRNNLGRRV